MRRIVSLAALVAVLAMSANVLAAEPKVGDTAPNFSLKGTDGKTYSLSDLKGKAIVIAWFPKAKTGGCTKECKSMKEFGNDLRRFNVAYFTASCDTPEYNKEFATELGLDYPILSDPTKEVATAYGVVHEGRAVPERWTFYIGKDGKIAYVDKNVKTDAHGQDIAAKLTELGVAKKS
jgi:peroxiredoxin Q/BCP